MKTEASKVVILSEEYSGPPIILSKVPAASVLKMIKEYLNSIEISKRDG